MSIRVELIGGPFNGERREIGEATHRHGDLWIPVPRLVNNIGAAPRHVTIDTTVLVAQYRRRIIRFNSAGLTVLKDRGWPYDHVSTVKQ